MNLKSFFIFLFAILISTSAFSQKDNTRRYYKFDNNWKYTTSDYYTYYRIVDYNSQGNFVGNIVDYYKNGNVQCIVEADTYIMTCGGEFSECGGENGKLYFYDINGNLTMYQEYRNGIRIDKKVYKKENNYEITGADVATGLEIAYNAYLLWKVFSKN